MISSAQPAFVPMQLLVTSVHAETPDIVSYELRTADGADLPAFTAGSHIDVELPNGMIRSYSLINSQAERHRYVIAVQKDRASRGGSRWIYDNLRTGNGVVVSALRNNFPLDETARKSIFIAGGIGITPILSMSRRLTSIGLDWELIYCCRTRETAAFIGAWDSGVRFNFDGEPGGQMLDITSVVTSASPNAHLYCCGPTPMLAAFEAATAHLPRERVHVEYFTAAAPAATEGGFTVVLARSAKEIVVPPGNSILGALLEAGLNVPHSCTEGVCGTCETRVLEGIPDHRDSILTSAQHASNRVILICCSGSKTARLVLDI